MKRLIFIIALVFILCACGESQAAQVTPTPQPTTDQQTSITNAPPSPQPTLAPIPQASELNQLISAHDGQVTDVTLNGQNVALDVQVNSPTQKRVKHLCFVLSQYFFSRGDVPLLNIVFHANGYTGADDPIASCGGPAPDGWQGMDENALWNANLGVFNVDLPA